MSGSQGDDAAQHADHGRPRNLSGAEPDVRAERDGRSLDDGPTASTAGGNVVRRLPTQRDRPIDPLD